MKVVVQVDFHYFWHALFINLIEQKILLLIIGIRRVLAVAHFYFVELSIHRRMHHWRRVFSFIHGRVYFYRQKPVRMRYIFCSLSQLRLSLLHFLLLFRKFVLIPLPEVHDGCFGNPPVIMLNWLLSAIFSSRLWLCKTSKLLIQIQYFLDFVSIKHNFRLLYYFRCITEVIWLRNCPLVSDSLVWI